MMMMATCAFCLSNIIHTVCGREEREQKENEKIEGGDGERKKEGGTNIRRNFRGEKKQKKKEKHEATTTILLLLQPITKSSFRELLSPFYYAGPYSCSTTIHSTRF